MSLLLIQISHLFKSFDSHLLFDDISLSLSQGERFALIGENGAGKTTLLQVLIGLISPDRGQIQRAPHLTIGFLPQEVVISHQETLPKQYIEGSILFELEKKMAICLEDAERLTEWAELHEEYEKRGGYRQVLIEKVLQGLKLETILDTPMVALSSGQRGRIALAKALLENPDLLLLDEPTNHLDQEMIAWLQETLKLRRGTTLIVSHDRKFLNETCNRLIEIKRGKLSCYGGSYDFYLEEQKRLLDRQMKAYRAQEEERVEIKQKIKAMAFSKSKASAPSDRDTMAYDYKGGRHQKSIKHTVDTLKARLVEIEANSIPHPKPQSIKGLRFSSTPLASKVVIELDQISKSFDEKPVFSECSAMLCKGERVLLTGPNGAGKTTLLRCILGLLPIDAGTIRVAPSAKIAYLDQNVEQLPMSKTPLEYFKERFNLTEEALRSELHKAALGGAELLNRPFARLSVGQRKRLMLLTLVLEKPNTLLLDEPTNHLDFLTLEALEKALLNFEGTILAVSHDSTFIKKIMTREWVL